MNKKEIAEFLSTAIYQCQYCGVEYQPSRMSSKFCSRRCGTVIYKRRWRSTEKGKAKIREENKRRLDYKKTWDNAQPSWKKAVRCARRRARIASVKLSSIEEMMVLNYYQQAAELTKSTGVPHEVDHIIPLSKSGPHHPYNLRVITRDENRSKGARI